MNGVGWLRETWVAGVTAAVAMSSEHALVSEVGIVSP